MTSPVVVTPDLTVLRARFPSLARGDGRPFVFADAPGGTQVPGSVNDAMSGYLATSNANTDGAFATSRETGDIIALARRAGADLLGCATDEVVFGQNMTTLAFALARALRHVLSAGDEVVVTRLDHDANISPWLIAAQDAGATVRWVDLRPEDCTLDLGSLERALGPRTRIVAFTMASNAAGTVTPAEDIVRLARTTGAIVVADAVHLAQHRLVDLAALGADLVFCSPYKVFGPHMGIMAGRRDLLATWRPDRVRLATHGAVRPGAEEVRDNPRSRSARLRAVERLEAA
jgi:cysteine desulfurase family protein (TIGR01976 family)